MACLPGRASSLVLIHCDDSSRMEEVCDNKLSLPAPARHTPAAHPFLRATTHAMRRTSGGLRSCTEGPDAPPPPLDDARQSPLPPSDALLLPPRLLPAFCMPPDRLAFGDAPPMMLLPPLPLTCLLPPAEDTVPLPDMLLLQVLVMQSLLPAGAAVPEDAAAGSACTTSCGDTKSVSSGGCHCQPSCCSWMTLSAASSCLTRSHASCCCMCHSSLYFDTSTLPKWANLACAQRACDRKNVE